ncbi:MAG: hydroxymethylglutaryl-CoA reductase, degradative [Clostridia bacterium]|nr:hydroxymethylglutaryl-CoA reductase, degradative [Deltaproteobacteria bacterium]
MDVSRIPEFYKLSVPERLRVLHERNVLDTEDYRALTSGESVLKPEQADKMVENVIGVFSLPMGLGLNFVINDKPYIIPLVVEEPSIIAALSSAAKVVRNSGGFMVESTEPILIGQIQVVDLHHPARARQAVLHNKDEILNLANGLHPKMVARGGGAKDVEVYIHPASTARGDMMIVHLLVNTCDAMGANLVNSMCEGVAGLVEKLTGGKVFLRILSNLTDRAMVSARCVIPTKNLAGKGYTGEQVRDGVILANDMARVDPYRAATHNKGIMNGVDAVAIATGNDWRAIEAAAHAYAARGSHYTSLTNWYRNEAGDLVGELDIPMKVGTVGGSLESNPAVKIGRRILNITKARELAEVMGAVGLAQNLSALRALSTEGIQRGHMTLHARSVAMAAGVPTELFDQVVEEMIETNEIKVWKAQELVDAFAQIKRTSDKSLAPETALKENLASGYGKVILLGEHAVVYGSHALAAAIPLAIQAKVEDATQDGVHVVVPRWGLEVNLNAQDNHTHSLYKSLDLILDSLKVRDKPMRLEIYPHVPRAMGLGGSAALAVAVVRALAKHYKLQLSDAEVSALAYESEKVAHGQASGIDNTMAAYGGFMLFKRGASETAPEMRKIVPARPIPIVVGMSGVESLTAITVGRVHDAWKRSPDLYEGIFKDINALTLRAVQAIERGDFAELGELMNINQGLLNALQVSSWELEELIEIARKNGASGAKLTGGGGGGSMIALCDGNSDEVARAMQRAGYRTLMTQID